MGFLWILLTRNHSIFLGMLNSEIAGELLALKQTNSDNDRLLGCVLLVKKMNLQGLRREPASDVSQMNLIGARLQFEALGLSSEGAFKSIFLFFAYAIGLELQ